ncbi:hypothetical protein LIER_15595 [Lithospermum erythrorhizon]|uniref:Uncharacterized protein n=1 Tax=Lithospermum erythrorhizon TaxID=34254 RepID=A0AAV3Q5Y4_LITER
MDPLPTLARAYGMVIQIYQQRQVQCCVIDQIGSSTLQVKENYESSKRQGYGDRRNDFRRKEENYERNDVYDMESPLDMAGSDTGNLKDLIADMIHQEVGKMARDKEAA